MQLDPDSIAGTFLPRSVYPSRRELGAKGLPGMTDKIAEYRRTAQMLHLLAEQTQFPDTREQLRRLAASFEALADRVISWEQKGKKAPANTA